MMSVVNLACAGGPQRTPSSALQISSGPKYVALYHHSPRREVINRGPIGGGRERVDGSHMPQHIRPQISDAPAPPFAAELPPRNLDGAPELARPVPAIRPAQCRSGIGPALGSAKSREVQQGSDMAV